jgi:hypothetical protein
MQSDGTAVLGRAEDAQVRPEPATELIGQVRQLPYGELAVALYASSMPVRRTSSGTPPQQIEAWAAEGLALLGAAQVWRLAWRTRHGTGPERDAIWPKPRREDTAWNMADAYLSAREADGYPWPRPDWVDVEYPDGHGAMMRNRYDRRDLEFAQRFGWPSSVLVEGTAEVRGSDRG